MNLKRQIDLQWLFFQNINLLRRSFILRIKDITEDPSEVKEKEFKKLAQIPENEIPIVLIFAGHYPKHSIKSPKSVRITDNNPLETVTIH